MSNPETVRVLILPDDVDPENLYVVFNFADYYQLEAKTMKLRREETNFGKGSWWRYVADWVKINE